MIGINITIKALEDLLKYLQATDQAKIDKLSAQLEAATAGLKQSNDDLETVLRKENK